MIEPFSNPAAKKGDDEQVLRTWRDAFVEVTQSRLETLEHELARLNESARELSGTAYNEWRTLGGTFLRQRRQAWDKLKQLHCGAPEAWPAVAAEVDRSRQDFAATLAQARSRLHSGPDR